MEKILLIFEAGEHKSGIFVIFEESIQYLLPLFINYFLFGRKRFVSCFQPQRVKINRPLRANLRFETEARFGSRQVAGVFRQRQGKQEKTAVGGVGNSLANRNGT